MEDEAADGPEWVARLLPMRYVLGYELQLSPTSYEITFGWRMLGKSKRRLLMHSRFTVDVCDKCCIVFCCVTPKCNREKNVHDMTIVEDPEIPILTMDTTDAFGPCCSCIEAGKEFHILDASPFQLVVGTEQVFVCAQEDNPPTPEQRDAICNMINESGLRENPIRIHWFD
jgi:hypothetical protein